MDEMKPVDLLNLVLTYVLFFLILVIAFMLVQDSTSSMVYIVTITLFLACMMIYVNRKKIVKKFFKLITPKAKTQKEKFRPVRRTDIDWNANVSKLKRKGDEDE